MASGVLYPESPVLTSQYLSPEIRGESSTVPSHSFRSGHAYRSHPTFIPTIGRIHAVLEEILSQDDESENERARTILRYAVEWGVTHGDEDLIAWLADLEGEWSAILDEEIEEIEDEEGWGLVGMAIQSSCGRQEKEEVVRIIVSRWGMECGPRSGTDRTGWTPLHLAALISTPPLLSFLLTRGASPLSTTSRGLTPLDLIAGMEERYQSAILLEEASSQGSSTSMSAFIPTSPSQLKANGTESNNRKRLLKRRREMSHLRLIKERDAETKGRLEEKRRKWLKEKISLVGVDVERIFESEKREKNDHVNGQDGLEWVDDEEESLNDTGQADDEDFRDGPNDYLVFALSSLPEIFDLLITNYAPLCRPSKRKALPANVLYLYAKFAWFKCDDSWLEELLEGAVERIEHAVYANLEDLAFLAFWAYNTTLLLYLLTSNPALKNACDELGLLGMVEELINAIHVFVIRVAEKRLDKVLDAAMLDYETTTQFEDVRFEGEWTLFRNFGSKSKKALLPKASQIFEAVNVATNVEIPSSPSSLFNSIRSGASPFKSGTPQTPQKSTFNSEGKGVGQSPKVDGTPILGSKEITPIHVTDILSGVYVVLQLYDVNPSITVQAFSQIFFWISCELFNRILTRKKYLCRSKAIQIKLNITNLEDWIKLNSLPAQISTKHLEPILQLLQWLTQLSSIGNFDHLIATVQGLKGLNPIQMKRAVKDYRFEVNESRMDDDCLMYLGQMQNDWERRRVQTGVKALQSRSPPNPSNSSNGQIGGSGDPEDGNLEGNGSKIDSLFDGSINLAEYVPATAPECFGELLDSRFMLPFQLPEIQDYLIAIPPSDSIYNNTGSTSNSPFLSEDNLNGRPSSRASFSSSRPLGFIIPSKKEIRELPNDFFGWLKDNERNVRRRKGSKIIGDLKPAVNPPLINGNWNANGIGKEDRDPLVVDTIKARDSDDRSATVTPTAIHPNGTSRRIEEYEDINTTPTRVKPGRIPVPQLPQSAPPKPQTFPSFSPPLFQSPPSTPSGPSGPSSLSRSFSTSTSSKGLKHSSSIDQLRSQAFIANTFKPLPHIIPQPGNHKRSESYELRLRRAMNQLKEPGNIPENDEMIILPENHSGEGVSGNGNNTVYAVGKGYSSQPVPATSSNSNNVRNRSRSNSQRKGSIVSSSPTSSIFSYNNTKSPEPSILNRKPSKPDLISKLSGSSLKSPTRQDYGLPHYQLARETRDKDSNSNWNLNSVEMNPRTVTADSSNTNNKTPPRTPTLPTAGSGKSMSPNAYGDITSVFVETQKTMGSGEMKDKDPIRDSGSGGKKRWWKFNNNNNSNLNSESNHLNKRDSGSVSGIGLSGINLGLGLGGPIKRSDSEVSEASFGTYDPISVNTRQAYQQRSRSGDGGIENLEGRGNVIGNGSVNVNGDEQGDGFGSGFKRISGRRQETSDSTIRPRKAP